MQEGGIPNRDDPFDWLGSAVRGPTQQRAGGGPRTRPSRPLTRYPRVLERGSRRRYRRTLKFLAPLLAAAAGAAAVVVFLGQPNQPPPPVVAQLPPEPAPAPIVKPWRIEDEAFGPSKIIRGKVGRRPFILAVQEDGLSKNQAYRVLNAFKGVHDLNKCRPHHRFLAMLNASGEELEAFEFVVSEEEIYQAREDADGRLVVKPLDMQIERRRESRAIAFDGESFSESAKAAGFEPGLTKAVSRALRGHLNLAELRRGDVVKVIASEVTVLGDFARYERVEALEHAPARGKPLRVYYFHKDRTRGHFDRHGKAPASNGWRVPIPGARVSSKFNPKRLHPVLKRRMPHNGTDYAAPTGTPVQASSYGTVTFVGYSGPSGNLVKVRHPGGYETGYAHLSRFRRGLRVGQKVKRLQLVGYVGSTGRSTGPHLHFSAKRNGRFIDPESLKLDGMRRLPRRIRRVFGGVRKELDASLDSIPAPLPLKPLILARPEPRAASEGIAQMTSTANAQTAPSPDLLNRPVTLMARRSRSKATQPASESLQEKPAPTSPVATPQLETPPVVLELPDLD